MAEVRPVVVNTDMVVLGGNMRLKAMREAGWKEVPIEVVDWDEDKQRQFIIKDNVSGGEWDWEMLANQWDAEQLDDWGLTIPSFDIEGDKEPDISDDIKSLYRIEVICKDEEHQENVYNKLLMEGFECRLLTL